MKLLLIVPAALLLAGCQFGQAFTRELSKQLADDVGLAVESKLGDDFKGVGDVVSGSIKAIPEAMPKPEAPPGSGENAGAVLLALIVANVVKFAGRKMNLLGAGEVKIKKDS